MKVKELIEMLQRCPSDMDVKLAYDSLVCIYDIAEESSFISYTESNYCQPGVYLCAMDEESIKYHMAEEGASPIPRAKK